MKILTVLLALGLCALNARAAEPAAEPAVEAVAPAAEPAPATPTPEAATPAPAPETPPAPAIKVVVVMPEQVDAETFWYYYSDVSQHLAQSKVEQALIRAGFEVIDLATVKKLEDSGSLERVTSNAGARDLARSAGATYAIVGKATAVKGGESQAYGVPVVRSSAEITARILRVSDGKVVESTDASAQKGGQGARAAGQEALKAAGEQVGRKLATALKQLTEAKE